MLRSSVQGPKGQYQNDDPFYDPSAVGSRNFSNKVNSNLRRLAGNIASIQRCLSVIAGPIAALPITAKRLDGSTKKEKFPRSVQNALDLIEKGTENRTRFNFIEQMVFDLGLLGNIFVGVSRAKQQLYLHEPTEFSIYQKGKNLAYYSEYTGELKTPGEIIHIALPNMIERTSYKNNLQVDHIYRGTSPLFALFNDVEVSTLAAQYVRDFFMRGLNNDLAISFPDKPNQKQIDDLKEYLGRSTGPKRARKPLIFRNKTEFHNLNISPQDAELLDTRRFTIEEVSRAFGVPRHLVGFAESAGGSLSGGSSSLEQSSRQYLTYTLQAYISRIEAGFSEFLMPDGWKFEFDTRQLARADSKSRAEYNAAALGGSSGSGWMTINEVRAMDGLSPVDNGNEITRWTMNDDDDQADSPEETTDEEP